MTRRGRGLLAAVLVALLSACTLDLDVHVEVEPDGSGAVEVAAVLDAGALARVGGDLGAMVDLDRLRADGWSVDGPTPRPDGGAELHLRQAFDDPAEADEVFADLAGSGERSPFRGLHVDVDRSPLRTRWSFGGTVDLRGGLGLPGVTPAADGEPLPDDLAALEDRLGSSLDRLLRLRVGVRLPGEVRSNATTQADNGAVWLVRFGDGPVALDASGSRARTSTYVAAALGAVVLVVGLVALLVRLAGRTTDPSGAPARR